MKTLIHILSFTLVFSTGLAHTKEIEKLPKIVRAERSKKLTLGESLCIGLVVALAGYGAYKYYKKCKKDKKTIQTENLLRRVDGYTRGGNHEDSFTHLQHELKNGANPNSFVRNSLPPSINNVSSAQLAIANNLPLKAIKLLILHDANFSQKDAVYARETNKNKDVATLLEEFLKDPEAMRQELEKEHKHNRIEQINKSSSAQKSEPSILTNKLSTDSPLVVIPVTTSTESSRSFDSPASQDSPELQTFPNPSLNLTLTKQQKHKRRPCYGMPKRYSLD